MARESGNSLHLTRRTQTLPQANRKARILTIGFVIGFSGVYSSSSVGMLLTKSMSAGAMSLVFLTNL